MDRVENLICILGKNIVRKFLSTEHWIRKVVRKIMTIYILFCKWEYFIMLFSNLINMYFNLIANIYDFLVTYIQSTDIHVFSSNYKGKKTLMFLIILIIMTMNDKALVIINVNVSFSL